MPVPLCCSDRHFNNEILSAGEKKKKVFQGRLSLPAQKDSDAFLHFECHHSRSNAVPAYAQVPCERNTHTQINHQTDVV